MNTVTVGYNQSLTDIALQEYGTLDVLLALAYENEKSVTDILAAGDVLNLPEYDNSNFAIRDYYLAKGIKPATGLRAEDLETAAPEGIGAMIIGTDFIVQ
jgi:hypothetical protein